MSESKQRFLLWWSLAFLVLYSLALIFLLKMFPPPDPSWSDLRVQEFYQDNSTSIRIGAVIASWTGAFLAPFFVVVGCQVARLEKGRPVWGVTVAILGGLMTVFLVFPPIFWGAAAFDADRSADVTALMHHLGSLTLVSTDQYFIFPWVAITAVCFLKTDVAHSPFPRWFGYFSGWSALVFEAGANCFVFKDGPLAWNGILSFWVPFVGFGLWMTISYVLLFRALKAQSTDAKLAIAGRPAAESSSVLIDAEGAPRHAGLASPHP